MHPIQLEVQLKSGERAARASIPPPIRQFPRESVKDESERVLVTSGVS